MAIFTSHISGSSGLTSLTGSLRIMSPHGTPQNMILTASHASFGPAIGIGTSVAPNSALVINDDLGLTDTSTTTRFTIADTVAQISLGTDTNNRAFLLWENSSGRLRVGTKRTTQYFNSFIMKDGRVAIGEDSGSSDPDSTIDLHVKGVNKTLLIGPTDGSPLERSILSLGDTKTKIYHDTFMGGQMVLQSTSSIVLVGDRGSGDEFAYLKGRNAAVAEVPVGGEDVRVEAPGGLQIDSNLNLTGSFYLKDDSSTNEKIIVSGSGHSVVSFGPNDNRAQVKVDRQDGQATIQIRRVDSGISANNVLGRIGIFGTEEGGATGKVGGGSYIQSKAEVNFTDTEGQTSLEFYNTKNGDTAPSLAGFFRGLHSNRLVVNDIEVQGGKIYNSSPAEVISFDGVNVDVAGNIKVGGDIIENSEGTTTITMDSNEGVTVAGDLSVSGNKFFMLGSNPPTINIGDSAAEDLLIHFQGESNSHYIGQDNTDGELHIGNGFSAGTGTAIKINSLALTSSLPMEVGDGLFFGATTNQGIMNSPGVKLNNSTGTSSASNRYIKLAEFPAGPTLGSADTLVTNLIVTVTGREYLSSYSQDMSLLVNVRYSYNSSSPYYYANGTSVSVTPLGNDFAEMGDVFYPCEQLYLTMRPGGNPELWLESSTTGNASRYMHRYATVFVTHLGGSGNASTTYTNAALQIMSNGLSEWITDDPKSGYDVVYAHYSDAYAGPGAILEEVQITGVTSHDVTNSQSYITTSAGNFWEATFQAPRSGAVHITVQFMAKYMANDVYLALGLTDEGGTLFTDTRMRLVGGSKYAVADYDYETIQYTFRLDGLTPGESTTVRPVVDGAAAPSGTTGAYTTGEIVIATGGVPGSSSAWANAQGRIIVQAAYETHGYTSIS